MYETFSRSRDVKNNSRERPSAVWASFVLTTRWNLVMKRRAKAWRPAPFTARQIFLLEEFGQVIVC